MVIHVQNPRTGKYISIPAKDTGTARDAFRNWAKVVEVFNSIDIRNFEDELQENGIYKGTMSLGRYARELCPKLLKRLNIKEKKEYGFKNLELSVFEYNFYPLKFKPTLIESKSIDMDMPYHE